MGSILCDEEPDTYAKKDAGGNPSNQPISAVLTARDLEHLAPVLRVLGVNKVVELNCIYMEDLLEEGVTRSDAYKLLQGFPTFGAIRPFHPTSPEQRALPLRFHGRLGAIGPRYGRRRRAQPHQEENPEPNGPLGAGTNNTPAEPTNLEWRQPRPFHRYLDNRKQALRHPRYGWRESTTICW